MAFFGQKLHCQTQNPDIFSDKLWKNVQLHDQLLSCCTIRGVPSKLAATYAQNARIREHLSERRRISNTSRPLGALISVPVPQLSNVRVTVLLESLADLRLNNFDGLP